MTAGLVISTDPTSGTTLEEEGQKVDLTLSLGAQAAPIVVPDVKGLSLTAATSELDANPYDMNVKTGFLQTAPPARGTC